MSIFYRMITDPAEFADVADLEARIWGSEPHELVAAHTLKVVLHTGGCLIGVYDDAHDPPTLIGFVLGFASQTPPDRKRLWSHIAAVDPDYQRQGIGAALKREQRTWAQSMGYEMISWTFDPLLSQNANFNLKRLGVQCSTYHVDFYGAMPNDLSRGLPSDRLEADWFLDESLKAAVAPLPDAIADVPFLLVSDDGQPRQTMQNLSAAVCCVEIPQNFLNLKSNNIQLAQRWQQNLRHTLQQAFRAGYVAVDFRRTKTQHSYILALAN